MTKQSKPITHQLPRIAPPVSYPQTWYCETCGAHDTVNLPVATYPSVDATTRTRIFASHAAASPTCTDPQISTLTGYIE